MSRPVDASTFDGGKESLTMTEDQIGRLYAFAARYAAAWSSQNAGRVATFYEETGSLRVNQGAPAVGREAIAAVAQGFMTAFPDMIVSLDELRIDEGVPHFHWTLDGNNTGPGGTGRPVQISGYERWSIGVNGLIAASDGHFDNEDYERQLRGEA